VLTILFWFGGSIGLTKVVLVATALIFIAPLQRAWSAEAPPQADSPEAFCASLTKVLGGAAETFASARGAGGKDSDNMWTASLTLPGAKTCLVFGGNPASYTCTLYAGDKEEKADWAVEDTIARIGKCLPDEWTSQKKADGVHSQTTFTGGASGDSIRVVSRIGSANAYFVEIWVEAAKP
jgi:hypothetical protein